MTSDTPAGPGHRDPGATPGLTESAKREAKDARDRLSHSGEAARHEAGDIADRLKQRARDEAEGRKQGLAESLHVFADTIRDASDDLWERDQSLAARIVRESANGLERISRSLDEHSFADATRGLRSFGREHPVAFVAGGMIAGLALGRMLRASSHHHDDYDMADELDHGDTGPGRGRMGSRTGSLETMGDTVGLGASTGAAGGASPGAAGTRGSTGGASGPGTMPSSSPVSRPTPATPGSTSGTTTTGPSPSPTTTTSPTTSPGTTGGSTSTTGGNNGRQ